MGYMFSWNKKQKLTRRRARQHRAHMTCTFHVHRHDVSNCSITLNYNVGLQV